MAGLTDRPFAAFDIDGTLIRWQLYHAVADELARAGCLGQIEYGAIREARLNWKRRTSVDAFSIYEQTLIYHINIAMTSISHEQLLAASRAVLNQYKDQVYTFTREYINQLKQAHYLLFAISASPYDIVRLVAEYYGFDDCAGSIYETKAGRFTGQKELLLSERKPFHLKRLAEKHQASWTSSAAVGDSENDIPMLEIIEKPVAFNPTRKLYDHAKKNGWRIVIERKDMVYDLGSHDGSYILA